MDKLGVNVNNSKVYKSGLIWDLVSHWDEQLIWSWTDLSLNLNFPPISCFAMGILFYHTMH